MQGTIRGERRPLRKGRLCTALLVVLSGSAGAIDLDYELGVAAKYSDNINLSETNEISDTVVSPRLHFHVEQIGRQVELLAQGNLEYRHYTDDTFDDEFRGRFAGSLNWMVIPERLDFVVQDYLSLQPVNELVEFTPDNQQQVNVFLAGPTLHARFDSTTRGQLDLRYIDSYAEESESFNSERFNAAGRLIRQLNANHEVSLNVEASDVQFDRVLQASDYRRYDGYVSSQMNRQDVDISLDAGYTRVEFDDEAALGAGESSYSDPLARATVNWRLSPRSVLGTTLRYQLTDATQRIIAPLDIDRIDFERRDFDDFRVSRSLAEPNVFRERMARIRYAYAAERTTVQVAPYYRRIRYLEQLVEDQDRRGVVASLEHRLRPRLTLSAYAAREEREFVDINREDDDTVLSVGLANRFTRHWTGRVELQRRDRDSTAPGRSYEENAVMISFSYQR